MSGYRIKGHCTDARCPDRHQKTGCGEQEAETQTLEVKRRDGDVQKLHRRVDERRVDDCEFRMIKS